MGRQDACGKLVRFTLILRCVLNYRSRVSYFHFAIGECGFFPNIQRRARRHRLFA